MPVLTYRDALNQALREEMQRDADVFLMGEEVGVYQGAYKVSRGLLEEFGPKRVVDTPIAELGFAGIGVGAAMAGLRPVIEFMTWNFAVLALDQIVNSAAKMLYMSGGQLKMPIVFRGPNGAALQLGSQHSQAWESWLAHIPGLKVVAPATPADAKGLLKAAIRDDNPVIVLEGEMLYNTKGDVPEGEHVVPIGRAEVKREGTDVTVICHSKTVTVALKAAEQLQEQNVSAEVLDLRSLRPMDEPAILASIAKTNRAVVVEEGWPHCGVGAQVVDIIQRDAFDQLDAPVQRVTPGPLPRLTMATTVHMEALSPTMEEGRLVKWTKKEGDPVKTGETLAEVETDKAVMELVARADGNLVKVLVPEGKTVPVGDVVAYIGAPGEKVGEASAAPAGTGKGEGGRGLPAPPPTPTPAPAATVSDERVKASPLAKRIARETGVDLKLLSGSGPGGRVVKRDLEGAPAAPPAPLPHPPSPIPVAARSGAAFEDVPLTQIRKTIARRLVTSLGPIPHFFLTTEVDMERAAEARAALNKDLGDQGKVSFNDIIVKATALALVRHRACNAWFQEDHIRYWNEVHLGMAVAVEDGLITPVIRNADQKTMSQISAEARALADKARRRQLKPDEYTGATFSVSNLGMFDIDQFTAVINPPEAGILAVGTVVEKPVVLEGQVVPRKRLRLTMSCDHRVIDGATGAAFLKTLKQMLENPLAMVL